MKTLMRVLLLSLAVMLAVIPSVSAATIDGLDIAITTNKENYKSYDDILVTHTITNTNDQEVSNMVLESKIPEGYKAASDKTYVKEVKTLAPGESVSLTTTMDSTTPRRMTTLSIVLICAGGVVVLGAGLSVTMLVLQKKKKKQALQLLSLVLCIGLLGGAVVPVMAGEDPTILNLTHEVMVDGKPLLLPATLTYDTIYGEKANLIVDTADMLFDEDTQTYHLLSEMPDLTGTLLYTEGVQSATCVITDDNDKLLFSKSFIPKNMWAVEDVGLIVGVNHIRVTVTYDDEMTYECVFKVNNVCEENMANLDVDKGDTDEDGVLNFIEELKHTDPSNPDTDGDHLTDYDEIAILGTDPLKTDTDDNGVADGDEDLDKDGLTNAEEINTHHSNPVGVDTDGDHLTDGDEVKTHGTDPTEADTDEDGKKDGWELDNEYDPLVPSDFPEEEIPTPDYVEVESDGEVTVAEVQNDFFINEETPGYIGVNPIDVELEEGHSATVTIEYDPETMNDEKPTMYYFNPESQRCEEVNSTVNGNKVTTTVNKSGMYVLLNHRLVEDVWTNDIFRPSEFNKDGAIDMVFVIDRSASMDSNDPSGLRKLVTKEFVGKLRDSDRAAAVQFTAIAEVISELTTDKETVCNAVDLIENSDGGGCVGSDANAGTNGSAGIRAAINLLDGSTAAYKYIIFLTDGADNSKDEEYISDSGPSLTAEAKSKNIVIHTVGLVGTGEVDTNLLKQVAAATGGQYFLATVGEEPENNPELFEVYDQIESVTIDRHLDSNNDGISDYYTRLICEGKLATQTGTQNLFGDYSYDEIQVNDDLDGDGIKNGDELVIVETDTGVFVKVVSLPYLKDSDDDGLLDNEEVENGTSPVRLNSYVKYSDVAFLTRNSNFASHEYLVKYNEEWVTRGAVWVGNAFFGTTLDQTILYRQVLLDYFVAIDETLLSSAEGTALLNGADAYYDAVFDVILEETIRLGEGDDPDEYILWVNEFSDFLNLVGNIKGGGDTILNGATNKKIESITVGLGKLANMKDTFSKDICTKEIANIAEQMKDIMYRSPDLPPAAKNAALNKLQGPLLDWIYQARGLKEKIKVRADLFKKAGQALDIGFLVIGAGIDSIKAYENYTQVMAAMATIEDNLYILDCISNNATNYYLRSAASDIRMYLSDIYNDQTFNFKAAFDQAEGVLSNLSLNILHTVIGSAGVPGAIIELVRTAGNLVLKLDKKAEGASKTVALAATAEVLAANYYQHLSAGYATQMGELWVAYNSYSEDIYVCILNLAELRSRAEAQYMDWKKSARTECQANIEKCDSIIAVYNAKYFMYLRN